MKIRSATAVVIEYERTFTDGRVITSLYGPFLPHAGSAVDDVLRDLQEETKGSESVVDGDATIRNVFIADGESDCKVVATR